MAERADGLAVREDDAEPEPLEDESMELRDGDVVAMAVKVSTALSVQRFLDTHSLIPQMMFNFLLFTYCIQGPAVVVAVFSG